MRKSKIEKRLPEPQHSKEQKADGTSVSPVIAKPIVGCSLDVSNIEALQKDLSDLKINVKNKVDELRDRYFVSPNGLVVMRPTAISKFYIDFCIDIGLLKNQG